MILYSITNQKDVNNIVTSIPNLEFKSSIFGDELPKFLVTNPMFQELNVYFPNHTPNENSGLFRKPYSFIHFEDFDSIDEWVSVYCIKEFTFKVYSQSGLNYAFDITDLNSFMDNEYKKTWITDVVINVKVGQILNFRPWLFHSFTGGIGHYFYLKENIDDNRLSD